MYDTRNIIEKLLTNTDLFDLQIHKNLETAEKIRALLDKHEKSQKELAEFLGVSENGLSGMMKNNSFKHQNMMKIARFFNVDLSFFNTNSGNVSHSQNEAGSASKESLIAAGAYPLKTLN